MGTWGPSVFSDDTACNVRDEYVDHLSDGRSSAEATRIMLQAWQDTLHDPDVAPVFWLSLASTQWRYGRLEENVRRAALKVIEDGSDLARWSHDPDLMRKRECALMALKQKLNSPQPKPKKVAKRFKNYSDWDVGDVISYRLNSARYVLIRVIGFHSDMGGTSPVVELLDWVGEDVPKESKIKRLNIREATSRGRQVSQFMIGRLKENELPSDRVHLIMKNSKVRQKPGRYMGSGWNFLDSHLREIFNVE